MKKTLFLSFAIVFILFACRKQVDVSYDDFEPVPVVNSLIRDGEVVQVHVSYAAVPGGAQLQGADNGVVELWINGEFAELLQYQADGWFQSDSIARQGNQYSIRWVYSETNFVEGTTFIPLAASMSNISHIAIAGKDDEGNTYPAVSFTIDNSPGEERFFEARIRLFDHNSESVATPQEIVDPVLLNEGLPLFVFSNLQMPGDTYFMTINYETGSHGSDPRTGAWVTRLYPLIVELRSVSKDYYLFVRQKYLYDQGRFPEFGLGANTTFPLYTNIEDGYGIVAGYSAVLSDTIYPTY